MSPSLLDQYYSTSSPTFRNFLRDSFDNLFKKAVEKLAKNKNIPLAVDHVYINDEHLFKGKPTTNKADWQFFSIDLKIYDKDFITVKSNPERFPEYQDPLNGLNDDVIRITFASSILEGHILPGDDLKWMHLSESDLILVRIARQVYNYYKDWCYKHNWEGLIGLAQKKLNAEIDQEIFKELTGHTGQAYNQEPKTAVEAHEQALRKQAAFENLGSALQFGKDYFYDVESQKVIYKNLNDGEYELYKKLFADEE